MSTYYELHINKTAKPMGKSKAYRGYESYDRDVTDHASIEDAVKHLKSQLWSENCKRVKIYRDGKNGEAIHTGYIYCFNTPAYSYDDCKHHEQWWVEIEKINSKIVNPTEWRAK